MGKGNWATTRRTFLWKTGERLGRSSSYQVTCKPKKKNEKGPDLLFSQHGFVALV